MDEKTQDWKEFFRLSELAEKWDRTEDYILQMAAAGRLTISAWWGDEYWEACSNGEWWGGEPGDGPLNDFFNIDVIDVKKLLLSPNVDKEMGVIIIGCHTRDGRKICLINEKKRKIFDKQKASEPIEDALLFPFFPYRSMLVLADEVSRVEAEYAEFRKEQIGQNQNQQKSEKTGAGKLRNPAGSHFLVGWKQIREYLGDVSESTAKRNAKEGKWLRHNTSNKPITTSFEIDEWRSASATKK